MGRTENNTQVAPANPAEKCLEWKGGSEHGFFQFWKKAEVGGENIKVDLPLKFVYLEQVVALTGWSDSNQAGLYSNEVLHLGEPLKLMYSKVDAKGERKTHVLVEGKYKDIKDRVKELGGKYTQTVYGVIAEDNGELKRGEVFRMALKGSAVRAWSDLSKEDRNGGISVSGFSDEKKGAIKYRVPVFTTFEIDKEIDDLAISEEHNLYAFFGAREAFFESQENKQKSEETNPVPAGDIEEDVPF